MDDKISFIISSYNEDNLYPLIERIESESSLKDFKDYEIIIVDDPDFQIQTYIKKYSEKIKLIKLNRKNEITKVVECFKYASGDIYVVIGADIQNLKNLDKLIWEIQNGADIAIVSRKTNNDNKSSIFGYAINKMPKILFPKLATIEDLHSGLFAMKKDVIKDIKLKPVKSDILFEILTLGKYKTVKEIPEIEYDKTDKTDKTEYNKTITIKTISYYLFHILLLAFREKESKRLMKFIITGLAGIVFSIFALWFLTEIIGIYYIISGLISKEIGILIAFLANEFWVFNDRIKANFKDSTKRCLQFNINRSVSMAVVLITMAILTEFLVIHYIVSNLIGILIAFPLNYVVSNKMIWSDNKNIREKSVV